MVTGDDRPSLRDGQLAGLEVWLAGTPDELDAAARALARIGHVLHGAPRRRLSGAGDAGRYRTYARIRVATTTSVRPSAGPVAEPATTLPDAA